MQRNSDLCGCPDFSATSILNGQSSFIEWNGCSHCRPATGGFYFQLAVKFVQALAHPSQTDTRLRTHSMKQPQTLFGYTLSEISHLQNHRFVLMLKIYARFRRSRMAMHVRQALLQDAEQSDLHSLRESSTGIRYLGFYVNSAAPGESFDIPLGCT